jgi:protein-S-isoprenylcysteine O-methyltransferase Ste14
VSAATQATSHTKACALICYALALAGGAALGARVFLMGLDRWPEQSVLPHPWLVNLAWLVGFGLQHSGMARAGFKRSWTKVIPPHLERSVYGALSGLLLLGLALTWQPLGGEPWWRLPVWVVGLPLAAFLALALIIWRFDHFGFFGLRSPPEQLLVIGPYRYVRHPMTACLLVVLWAQPIMTPTLVLLSGGLSAYLGIGLVFEERDLRRRFGTAYAAYRRRVPALVPWRPPAAPAVHPAGNQC